jgi:hypothetical protein
MILTLTAKKMISNSTLHTRLPTIIKTTLDTTSITATREAGTAEAITNTKMGAEQAMR